MRVFLTLRWMVLAVFAVAVSSVGCQTTKIWPRALGGRGTNQEVAAKDAPTSLMPDELGGTEKSLESASSKIDRAVSTPESEPRSYYAGQSGSSPSNSSSTCTRGCCK
jgi:hypothetical protein